MDITPSVLRNMRNTFSSLFRGAYDRTPVMYPQLCTTVPSTSGQNNYGWMAQLPKMREWIGARAFQNLITQAYVLENKEWELSFSVPRKDIEDENLGQYAMFVPAYGEAARKHPDELLFMLLKNAHQTSWTVTDDSGTAVLYSGLCFDGQPFFNASHPVNSKDSSKGTYSNYVSTGQALTAANYDAVRAKMSAYVGESGASLNIVPDLIIVPPALEGTAKTIVASQFGAGGATNIYNGTAQVLMVPELAGADTTWYLASTGRVIKPFVYQPRRPVAFVNKTNLNDDNVVYERQYDFMADSRDNMGFTLPFLIHKSVA